MGELVNGARVAAFDIGSNSIKMTVASVTPDGTVTEIVSDSATTRLGQGVDQTRRLSDERIAASMDELVRMATAARAAGATTLIGVATEAVRIAVNGVDLLADIRSRVGIDVVKISGDREAALAYAGLATLRTLAGPVVMVDIGGASTEIVMGDGNAIIEAVSVPIGSGRLTDTWIENDPPSWAEVAAARVAAADRLAPIRLNRHAGARLIVAGGPATYLSTYLSGRTELTLPEIDAALARMGRLPSSELAPLIGGSIERARILPAGVAIILAAADRAAPMSIETAPSGLRIGLMQAAAKGLIQ